MNLMVLFSLYFVLPVNGNVLRVHKRDWIDSPPASIAEGDVECFSEYMELWIHRMRIEGLRLWLSSILRIQVTLTSLESLNHQLSACGFGLHRDPDRNFIFRVMYSGCFVQLQHGHYVIALNLMKRISRFGGRTQNYVMKCPVVAAPPNREHIQCDPDFIQVTRQIPLDSWNNELTWALALRGSLVVALEDASLIQVNVDIQMPYITVQGRRNTVLSPVQILQTESEFLPLKLVSGHYAYSMEATCPNVIQHSSEDTVLHIYKRRMGLTKRGEYGNETLSVSSVSVNQTDTFTWSEAGGFVQLIIPTVFIQKTKKCTDKEDANSQQSVLRIDVVLTFKETNNKMLWTMENSSPCLAETESQPSVTSKPPETEQHNVSYPTLPYAEATDEPQLPTEASSMAHQTPSQGREEGLSSIIQDFPSTTVPRESFVSQWSTNSPESSTAQLLNSKNSLSAHTSEPNEQMSISTGYQNRNILESFAPTVSTYVSTYVTSEHTLPANKATPSLSSSSASALPKQFVDFPHESVAYNSTTGNRISTTTHDNLNQAVQFTAAPSHTGKFNTVFKWIPVTSLLSSESTSKPLPELKRTIPVFITLNPQPVSPKSLQLHQGHTQPSLPPPQPNIVNLSTDSNGTALIHTEQETLTGL